MRGRFVAVVAITCGLVAAAPASAGPPRTATIASVSSNNRHVTAMWTLPPGVQSDSIEIANNPATGSDGRFFGENVKGFDILQPGQTSYVATDQLDQGVYYVHVSTFDNECSYVENNSCYAESPTAQVTIALPANQRPTLKLERWLPYSNAVAMSACDETASGRLTFHTALTKRPFAGHAITKRRTYRSASTPTFTEGERGCGSYYIALPGLYGVGRYAITMTVTDSRGGASKPFVRRWVTRD